MTAGPQDKTLRNNGTAVRARASQPQTIWRRVEEVPQTKY